MGNSKYRLLNKWGNRVVYTNSETEKNILLDRGFHIDEEWKQTETHKPTPTAPKRKAVKKNEGQTKN